METDRTYLFELLREFLQPRLPISQRRRTHTMLLSLKGQLLLPLVNLGLQRRPL